jgi:hypothetical protein
VRAKRIAAFSVFLIAASTANADTVKSAYTKFILDHCKQTQKPDGQIFEGAWKCKGIAGYDIFISAVDSREYASFGKTDASNCAGLKTFSGFNSVGDTIEWRLKNGKPIAAIQRWTVSNNPEKPESHVTWLVVNKLSKGTSCQMHYVAGSFPNANEVARKVADEKTDAFNCETGKPTFDSTIGEPDINMEPCSAQPRE